MSRALIPLVLLVAACGPRPALELGAELFGDPAFAASPSNVFSCATCHEVTAAPRAGNRPPGFTLHNAAARPTYWGGAFETLLDAVNECYVEYMRGHALSPDNTDGRALRVYLQSITPDKAAPSLPLTTVTTILDVPNGDPAAGEATWRGACSRCHGEIHTGKGRLGPRISIVPDETLKTFGTDPLKGARPITIEKIRHGKYFGISGNMAPYSLEALTDGEVGGILAYLGL